MPPLLCAVRDTLGEISGNQKENIYNIRWMRYNRFDSVVLGKNIADAGGAIDAGSQLSEAGFGLDG